MSPGFGRRHRYQAAGLLTVLIVAVVVVLVGNLGGGKTKMRTTDHTHLARGANNPGRHASGQARSTTSASNVATASGGGRAPGTEAVPILMYHVIAAPPAGAPFPGLYVAAERVRRADGSARSTPAGTP